ncbi:MAG: Gfo/Idh/MocA family oxidoreductase [Oscillospiraceae bacterium]|nr:Gfo/Idh/MocA family oxidoreductase [Oscillospiraceae bacterium]
MSIRVGILGCATIACRSLMPAIHAHSDFKLKAIASRFPDKVASYARQYVCRACSYCELVVDPDIDLIYVPLPTGLHFEWVMKCLKNGKHVLCEKSLACTEKEVKVLVAEAKKRHLFLMESFQFRFHSQNLYVNKLLSDGMLGQIRCVRASFGFPPFKDGATNIRYKRDLGGGALLDAGAYTVKATTFLLGPEVTVEAASSWTDPNYEVDLGGGIFMQRSDGVVSETAYGFDNFYQCGYEIWCTRGRLMMKRAFTAPPGFEPECILETAAGVEVKKLPADDHFARLLDYVANCIETNTFENEYRESLIQSRLIQKVKDLAHV